MSNYARINKSCVRTIPSRFSVGPDAINHDLGKLYGELFRSQFRFVPQGEHRLKEIYAMVKTRFPTACDDTFRCCDHCSSKDPGAEWKHRVRSSLNDLRKSRNSPVRRGVVRGAWIKT